MTMALHYQGNPADPAGPWYEAALPSRFAFCMRDVSHQCIGAEIAGMHRENKNMFSLFAANISQSKDWCSYWEINKYGRPAPEDYRNEGEFWYNLPANFDALFACWRLYLWTGDKTYIDSPAFAGFHCKSVNDYIKSWSLQCDSIMTRPEHPHAPNPFNPQDAFHTSRGLPSYTEGVPGMRASVDLLAAIYRGLLSYAAILETNGHTKEAATYTRRAIQYRDRIEREWWDPENRLYRPWMTMDGKFGIGEAGTFLLWFDALKDSTRLHSTLTHLLNAGGNVESLSYLPAILYKYGYAGKAYELVLHLTDPATPRSEYPEVSFAVLEAIVQGLMGVEPDARINSVATLYRGPKGATAELDNVRLLHTIVDMNLSGDRAVFSNRGHSAVNWRTSYPGIYTSIRIGSGTLIAKHKNDGMGNVASYVDVLVPPGRTMTSFPL
jgi:hypothetical protein